MRSTTRGTIEVRTRRDGEDVIISIRDAGTGISERDGPRVFDPFFTTKEVGKGTGQGLALAHAVVVEKPRGKLWFETELGRGTTCFIQLPIAGAPLPFAEDGLRGERAESARLTLRATACSTAALDHQVSPRR